MAAKKSASAKSTAPAKLSGASAKKTSGAKATTAAKEKSAGEFITALAEATGLSKAQTKSFLDAHAALLVSELNSAGSVQLPGIGKLKLGQRAQRQGRNPSTGEAITIKASKTVKFSGAKRFKDSFQ